MKILIADDEVLARDRLRQMLADLQNWEVVGEASNGRETLELCQKLSPDIVLLDIRMPDMDGMEAARHLADLESGPAVIFTTAYDHYAIEAFDAHAVGYLLKPVRQERLLRALNHASRPGGLDIESFPRTHICVRRVSGLQLIPVTEILYLQADKKYVTVHHLHGEDLVDETLKDLATEFANHFIRIHRNTLIALTYLDHMERDKNGQFEIRLKGCEESLAVSRRHISAVKACLKRSA